MQPKRHLPTRLHEFLTDLEATNHSRDVWELITALGRAVDLPYFDVISASDFRDWSRTLFIRTSYDASWLHTYNQDPELFQWSYFRSYCAQHPDANRRGL